MFITIGSFLLDASTGTSSSAYYPGCSLVSLSLFCSISSSLSDFMMSSSTSFIFIVETSSVSKFKSPEVLDNSEFSST